MQNTKKFFKVQAERGHIGAGGEVDITFYFEADNAYDAMCQARKMPGVKHHKMPNKIEEITEEEYLEGRKQSAYHKEGREMHKGANHKGGNSRCFR